MARYAYGKVSDPVRIHVTQRSHRRPEEAIFLFLRIRQGEEQRAILSAKNKGLAGINYRLEGVWVGDMMRDARDHVGDTVTIDIGRD